MRGLILGAMGAALLFIGCEPAFAQDANPDTIGVLLPASWTEPAEVCFGWQAIAAPPGTLPGMKILCAVMQPGEVRRVPLSVAYRAGVRAYATPVSMTAASLPWSEPE